MDIRNCIYCRRIFKQVGGEKCCPACREEDEKNYSNVKEYLLEHKGASIYEVSSVLNIPVRRIQEYLREGRLEIIEEDNCLLKCERCGKPIKTGKHCNLCVIELKSELKKVLNSSAQSVPGNALNQIRYRHIGQKG